MTPQDIPTLDPATFLFFLAIFGYWMSLISVSTARSVSPNISGLHEWAAAMFCFGTGVMLFFFQQVSLDFVTVCVGNTVILGLPAFIIGAHSRFFGIAYPRRLVAILLVPGILGAMGSYFWDRTLAPAVIGGSASIAAMMLVASWQVFRHGDWKKTHVFWLPLASMPLISAALLLRIAVVIVGEQNPAATLHAKSTIQFVFFVAASLLAIGVSMGFILMAQDRQKHELLETSRLDGLTGLYNRKAFFDGAANIDAVVPPEAYSVAMLDIDFFKKVNDTYGHAAGDVTLTHFARLIATSVRSCDLVGRYGGEEFCVLLRDCDAAEAARLCNRLVEQARKQVVHLPDNRTIRFTVSAGYATRNANDPRPRQARELVELADQALYRAKHSGRDQAIAA